MVVEESDACLTIEIEGQLTYQTSCFWPDTRAAGLKGSSRLEVADMVRSGVYVSLVGVLRLAISNGRSCDGEENSIRIYTEDERAKAVTRRSGRSDGSARCELLDCVLHEVARSPRYSVISRGSDVAPMGVHVFGRCRRRACNDNTSCSL